MGFTLNSNSLAGLQGVYDGGTPAQKAAFQSSVSGAGVATVDATRGTDLSAAERQAHTLVFAGSLSADVTFDLGATRRRRVVDAQTGGPGRLMLKFGSTGTAFAIPHNEVVEVQ